MRERILVTGAGGFIGSHLTERLIDSGHTTTTFLRYTSTANRGHMVHPLADMAWGDIRNRDDVIRAMRGCTIVVHLAAQIAIPYSYISSADFVTTNIIGTENVLMAAKELHVRRVVYISTSEVYGTAQEIPITEKHPLVAQSPYAASKIGAEKLCEAFNRTYGTPIVVVRPFNTYGPRQSARAVIPSIIQQALNGDCIQLANFLCRRDFNYVGDTVDSLMKVVFSKDGCGQVFNLATGQTYSLIEVVKEVAKISGRKLQPVIDEKRTRPKNSEVLLLVGDSSKAKEVFGVNHSTSLMDGLKKTWDYYKENRKVEVYTI